MWAQLSDEQKETYGEEYFEKALRSLEKYTANVNIFFPSNIWIVNINGCIIKILHFNYRILILHQLFVHWLMLSLEHFHCHDTHQLQNRRKFKRSLLIIFHVAFMTQFIRIKSKQIAFGIAKAENLLFLLKNNYNRKMLFMEIVKVKLF